MWCFMAYMAARDYMSANLGARGKAAWKSRVQILQEPDTTQHTSGQKLVFTNGHDPSNVSIVK